MTWKQWLMMVGTCGALFAIVPLMVWGGSGDWRHALRALRQYLGILGALALLGGGLGLVMAVSEHGLGVLWAMLTNR